ncbi:MAG: GDCCVxC domain-containing (seleno)protein [Beijerinckiaceae bacterium]
MNTSFPSTPIQTPNSDRIIVDSVITCPQCSTAKTERMPLDACQIVYECTGCGVILQPRSGDCRVYCSYGSVPRPPIQAAKLQQSRAASPDFSNI